MSTKIYWIHTFDNSARIGIMARPCGNDWLEEEIVSLKNNKVEILVSLLERDEIYDLKLEHEAELCRIQNIDFINFPIPDRDIPKQDNKIEQFINFLNGKLNSGLSVVIHCRMGIGRSSIIAAAVLLNYKKLSAGDIMLNISKIRGVKVPDTEKQLEWLKAREYGK